MEAEIRLQVAGSPCVKVFSERECFTKHLLSEEQKAIFWLLIAGFCRKFATLVSDCSKLLDKKNRKGAFSVAWMKLLETLRSRFGHLTANGKPWFAVSGFTVAVCPYLGLKTRGWLHW